MFNLLPIFATILQQNDEAAAFIPLIVTCCCMVIVLVPFIAGMWKIFEKAGQPGWASLVPIYNFYVLCTEVNGREPLFIIFFFLPIANIIAPIVMMIDTAKSFGKDTVYGLGLYFLSIIFVPMLGFGDDQYVGPSAKGKGLVEF